MRDLLTIFRFELKTKLGVKAIRVSTLILLLICFALTFVPRFMNTIRKAAAPTPVESGVARPSDADEARLGLILPDEEQESILALPVFQNAKVFDSEENLREAILNGEVKKAVVMDSLNAFRLLEKDMSLHDQDMARFREAIFGMVKNLRLAKAGIDPAEVARAEAFSIDSRAETLGKNAFSGYFFAYFGMFSIYMIVLLFGAGVATTVAREKNDRTMELLITSTEARYLIWGKVLANSVVSFIQLLLLIAVLVLGVRINIHSYPPFLFTIIREGFSAVGLAIFLLYMLTGSLLYYFLYAAVGSLVSKVEDVGSATAPIQFIFIGSFLLCSFGMNNVQGALMRVLSLFPFSSPMAMFIRYSMATVPAVDLALSMVFLLLTTIFMAFLAIRIYRMGSLNYGNKIGFFKAAASVFRREKI